MKAHTIRRREAGASFIEFVLILPLLVTIFYGVVEISRYIQMHQKTDNAVHTMVDLINQNLNLSLADLTALADSFPTMLSPYDASGFQLVVTAANFQPPDDAAPKTLWQFNFGTTGNASKISTGKGRPVTLPGGLTLLPRDQVITVEAYTLYRPIFDLGTIYDLLGIENLAQIYKVSVARPRYGSFQFEPK